MVAAVLPNKKDLTTLCLGELRPLASGVFKTRTQERGQWIDNVAQAQVSRALVRFAKNQHVPTVGSLDFLRLRIEGILCEALLDNQSSHNLIRYDIAQRTGCEVTARKISLKLANGSTATSGTEINAKCLLDCSIAPSQPIAFSVIQSLPYAAVLGRPFLDTLCCQCLLSKSVDCTCTRQPIAYQSHIGLNVRCSAHGRSLRTSALLDSGAEINLMSFETVKAFKSRPKQLLRKQAVLRLVDGSTMPVLSVLTAVLDISLSNETGLKLKTTFTVVEDLAVGCLLGISAIKSLQRLLGDIMPTLEKFSFPAVSYSITGPSGKIEVEESPILDVANKQLHMAARMTVVADEQEMRQSAQAYQAETYQNTDKDINEARAMLALAVAARDMERADLWKKKLQPLLERRNASENPTPQRTASEANGDSNGRRPDFMHRLFSHLRPRRAQQSPGDGSTSPGSRQTSPDNDIRRKSQPYQPMYPTQVYRPSP